MRQTIIEARGTAASIRRGLLWMALTPALMPAVMPAVMPMTVSAGADDRIVHAAEAFVRFAPATGADMVARIPGISIDRLDAPADALSESDARGFGGNPGRLLINGKRVAGKQNDSAAVLQRIPASRVLRIEILPAGTGESGTAGRDPVVNLVLEDTDSRGSGTWEVDLAGAHRTPPRPGGKATWGGVHRGIDYLAAVEVGPDDRVERRKERRESIAGMPGARERAEEKRTREDEFEITTNVGYGMDEGDLRVNLLVEGDDRRRDRRREVRFPAADGGRPASLRELEQSRKRSLEWELGVDYERTAGHLRGLRLVLLHRAQDTRESTNGLADSAIDVSDPMAGLRLEDREEKVELALETIVRLRLERVWREAMVGQIGVELARNTLDTELELFERDGAALAARDVFNSDQVIEELRAEPFALVQWQLRPRTQLELELVGELTRLSQRGSDVRQQRRDALLRPRIELQHRRSDALELRATLERTISQLDFGDFVASVDREQDRIEAGNPDLEPQTAWGVQLAAEWQLPAEGGRVGLTLFQQWVDGVIEQIPGSEGAKPGNAGDGRLAGFDLSAGFRLDAIGLDDTVLDVAWLHRRSQVRDPFTGERRAFAELPRDEGTLALRRELESWRAALGIELEYEGSIKEYDDEQMERETTDLSLDLFAERRIGASLRLRLELHNLLDARKRTRILRYGQRSATAMPEEIERAREQEGRALTLSLQGTF